MAESSIAGLFQDPLLYQQAQDQAALQRFTQLAQLDPLQQAQASLMYGGYQAGGALGRALGGEDPMLQRLSMRNQLASQFDTSSAEGLTNLSNALRQKGDLAGASQVAHQALLAREKEASIQAKTAEKLTTEQRNAAAYASTVATPGTPEYDKAFKDKFNELTTKEGKQPEIAQLQSYRDKLVETYGENDSRVKQVDAAIAKVTKSKMSLEEALSAGLGAIGAAIGAQQAKSSAAEAGKIAGKNIAEIEGPQSALDAIKGAKNIFNKGIYAGKYGPTMENIAGYTEGVVGSKERLANTEEFRAYLGDVVIPGLQDFGGSDTVEELKYLQAVYAGDTSAQPKALQSMLNRAEKKITAKIERIQNQQKAIAAGKELPTGPSVTPKATKRYNPTTGKLEPVE